MHGARSPAEVLGRVVSRLSRPSATQWPAFALVTSGGTSGDGEVVVLVHGETSVSIERAEGPELHLSAETPGMWFTRAASGVTRVVLGAPADAAVVDALTDLRAGVLAADGAVLIATPEPQAEPGPDAAPGLPAPMAAVAAPLADGELPAEVDERAGVGSAAELGSAVEPGSAGELGSAGEVDPSAEIAGAPDDDAVGGDDDATIVEEALEREALEGEALEGEALEGEVLNAPEALEASNAAGGDATPDDSLEVPTFVASPEAGWAAFGASPTIASPVTGPSTGVGEIRPDAREGLPGAGEVMVTGRYCGRHHFNAPRDRWCRICGLALGQDPEGEVEDPRPALGVLVWDSGESDVVKRDTVVGRDPSSEAGVVGGTADAVSPRGQSEGMSRVHAELRLIGWEVLLADRGSTNGTFVWDEARQEWHRLEPGERCPLHIGAIVAFGERTATFEALSSAA